MKKVKEPEYVVLSIVPGKLGEDLNRFYAEGYELDQMNGTIAVLRKTSNPLRGFLNDEKDTV